MSTSHHYFTLPQYVFLPLPNRPQYHEPRNCRILCGWPETLDTRNAMFPVMARIGMHPSWSSTKQEQCLINCYSIKLILTMKPSW